MKWSWKIGRLAGIDVYIHATFLLLIAWFGFNYWLLEGSLAAVISGVGFILVLFGCVVLHELGHALTARRYGIKTRHIVLLPIGGIASMEKMPDDPGQEIRVALAGPAVNLAIAFLLWLILLAGNGQLSAGQLGIAGGSFLQRLLLVNIILAVFNLLPAFPMDGGRVLRAALALRMDHGQATRIAAVVGQGLAIGLGFLGLLYNPFLILIALFVWIGAGAEAGAEQMKSTLSGAPVGRAMLTQFETLSPDDSLGHAIELTLAGTQKDFPVLAEGRAVGVLGQRDLLQGLREYGELGRIDMVMQRDVQSADIAEPLQQVLERLQSCNCRLLAVTDAGKLAGIVDIDNVMELLKILSALREHVE